MSISSVKATINGQVHTLTYNSTSGKWEATVTAPSLSSYNQDGHYYPVSLEATDNAGNTATATTTHTTVGNSLKLVVKEKVAPTITITAPTAGAYIVNNKPTITAQLRDADSGVDISTLSLQIDSNAAVNSTATGMTATKVTGGYDITYAPQTALSDGNHTAKITVKDFDGNAATQATVTFKVDTVLPTLSVTSPTAGLVTNKTTGTVAGTTNDATSSPVTIKITLNGVDQGAVTVGTNGSFTKSVTYSEGENTIVVTATDAAGKTSTVTRTVTINTKAPKFTAVTITPNPVDCGNTFVIAVTVTEGS